MRILVNVVGLLVLVALVVGAWLFVRNQSEEERAIAEVRSAVVRLAREVKVQSATNGVELNGRGWPMTIDPHWFHGAAPRNVLLDTDRPWLEIAPQEQAELQHPPVRLAIHRDTAAFWYNPGNGVVRARVPIAVSDRRSTELYNRVNGSRLESIFQDVFPNAPKADQQPPEGQIADAPTESPLDEMSEENMDPTKPRDP